MACWMPEPWVKQARGTTGSKPIYKKGVGEAYEVQDQATERDPTQANPTTLYDTIQHDTIRWRAECRRPK